MTAPAELGPLAMALQREYQDHNAESTEDTVGDRPVRQASQPHESHDRGEDPPPQAVAKHADAEQRHDESADDLGSADDAVHSRPTGADEDPVRTVRGAA